MFHPYLLRVMAQEKDTCALVLVGCFWLFNLENRIERLLCLSGYQYQHFLPSQSKVSPSSNEHPQLN